MRDWPAPVLGPGLCKSSVSPLAMRLTSEVGELWGGINCMGSNRVAKIKKGLRQFVVNPCFSWSG
jgi:hypothetical protein